MRFQRLALVIIFISLVAPTRAEEKHWFKGNLHTHSLWSDGDDFPEMIADWYREHGYDFLALSDHNVLSIGERWMPLRDIKKRGGDIAMEKYRKRFPDVVQMRKGEAGEEVRLQPLDKVRELLEEPGKFLMIQSEEMTTYLEKKPIHMNATNIGEAIQPASGKTVREIIAGNLRAVEEQAKRLNRPIITHLNHPNFGWGVSADDLANVVEEHYFEVFNGHPAVNQLGDAMHPSVEKIWDVANTIRLAQLHAAPLMGLGTDDAHHYHTPGMSRATSGRGWVMCNAKDLSAESIVDALKTGDFYASSGVTLKSVRYDEATKTIDLEINPDADATFTTNFVGTPKDFADGGKTPLDSDKVGTVFASVTGNTANYKLNGNELYVRAVITSSKPPVNPSFENQRQQAWTQPVGWSK